MIQTDQAQDIVARAIDMHVHIGPEVIPRKYTAASLDLAERGKLRGAVLKNHFYATAPFVAEVKNADLELYGAIVLNNSVGGLNPEAVRAAAALSDRRIVVWMPTISAEQFLENSEFEIAPEWTKGTSFQSRKASKVQGISLQKNGALTQSAKSVIDEVANIGAVLATGHISWQESVQVTNYALSVGANSIIVTHPIYQRISMPIEIQKELVTKGCFMEVCYSMFSLDDISIKEIAKQIKEIGPDGIVLSSDVGQKTSESPSEALTKFCKLLLKEKIPVEWLEIMLVKNPRKLLGEVNK